MVILVPLGGLLLIAMILPALGPFHWPGSGRFNRAALDLATLEAGTAAFRSDTGRLPTDAEGIQALLKDPRNIPGWHGPYIDEARLNLDPWGHFYIYRRDPQGPGFVVRCLGPDGKLATADDLVHHVAMQPPPPTPNPLK